MAENSLQSRLAIVPEVTEGTLVDPSAGTQFIPLQPGFEFVPNIDTIENEEIRGSIGSAKPIQGLSKPTSSFKEYLKHSGVEGQAPNWGELLEALFGSTSTNSTQRTTTTSSSTTVIKLGAGGSDFARGKAVLIKDGTNGYSIRPVDSVSTNDLTLGFAVSVAPATGINVGKCVNYTPADSGHQTLSLWLYRGNGGALEAIAGARVTEWTMDISVGELINQTFGLGGTGFYMNPMRVDATNNKLNFTDDDGTVTATIPSGVYKDPHELAAAVTSAMNTANGGETHTCSFNSLGANKGKFTILSTGTVLSLLWKTGTNGSDNTDTHIGTLLGFDDTADDTGTAATTGYTSDNVQSYAATISPSYDSADPMIAQDMEILIGDQTSYDSVCVKTASIKITNEKNDILCISAATGVEGSVINKRTTEITIIAQLSRHDADKFRRFLNNVDTKFLFNFGVKSGGNWVAGKCGCVYAPTATIAAYQHGDDNGIVTMEYTIRPFVNSSGQPEIYLNFL